MAKNFHRKYLDVLRREIADGDRLLADTQKQIDDLHQQIDDLHRRQIELKAEMAEIRRVEEFVSHKASVAAHETDPDKDKEDFRPPTVAASGNRTNSLRPHGDVIEDVLRDATRPMSVQEIIDAVRATGQPLPHDRKLQYSAIYAALTRRQYSSFEKVDRSMWGLISSKVGNQADDTDDGNAATNDQNETYAQTAESVIRRLGRPVKALEIVDWIVSQQIRPDVTRSSLRKSVYHILCTSDKFRKLGPGIFELAR